MSEITPEIQAVLDALPAYREWATVDPRYAGPVAELRKAIDAYLESINPPPPFTCYAFRRAQEAARYPEDPEGFLYLSTKLDGWDRDWEAWEVEIRPIKKVSP